MALPVYAKVDPLPDAPGEVELLEEEQYTLFCQQVREEEERGSLSYLSVSSLEEKNQSVLQILLHYEMLCHLPLPVTHPISFLCIYSL